MTTPQIARADLDNPYQANALVTILDTYARGPEGQGAPMSERAKDNLSHGLRDHPAAIVLMAFVDDQAVGAAVCLWGYSTFGGSSFLNIHDLAVLPDFRGRGIGKALIAAVEETAREQRACKVSLEVHDTNEGAKRLYRSLGFGPWEPVTLSLGKKL